MGRTIVFNFVRFVLLILLQVFLFKNIGYYNLASPFPYILIIFLLPIGLPNLLLYMLAFLTGFCVDLFYDSLGVHAAACVALAWYRTFFHNITLEVDMKDSYLTPNLGEMGFKWFLSYIFFGTLVHHTILYLLEVFSFYQFQYTLLSIGLSCIFTLIIILLSGILFFKKKTRYNT